MRRLLTGLAGAVGGLAAYRAVARHRRPAPEAPDGRAEELREKLARARVPEEEPPPPEPVEPVDPDERRRAVHEQGKAALDEMRRD